MEEQNDEHSGCNPVFHCNSVVVHHTCPAPFGHQALIDISVCIHAVPQVLVD